MTETELLDKIQRKLEAFERPHPISMFQAGDEDRVCATCQLPVLWTREVGWIHSPDAIRHLYELAEQAE